MARATMESVGYWMQIYGKAIYNGRPYIARHGQRDFILRDIRDPKTYYLFKYDLSCTGDHNVSVTDQGNGVVSFDGFEQTVSSIAWMDSHQPLDFSQSENTLTVGCTGFPYGKNHCVRVAEIKTI
jgi:hypothetical protein